MAEYAYQCMHNQGEYPCGGVAFLYNHKPEPGERIKAEHAVYPDGEHPKPQETIKCGSCNQRMEVPTAQDVKPLVPPRVID